MQTSNDPFSHQFTLRDICFVLFKHKLKIVFFFLTITLVTGFNAILIPKVYQSEARLFIKLGKEMVSQNSSDRPDQRIQVSQSMENQINSELEILTSQELSQQVLAGIGADAYQRENEAYAAIEDPIIGAIREKIKKLLEFPQNAVANFLRPPDIQSKGPELIGDKDLSGLIIQNLKAEVVKESNIIKLYYETQNPYLSRDVLTSLINLYMEKHIKLVGTQGSFDFFKKESDRLLEQLETTEKELSELKNAADAGSSSQASLELQKTLYDLRQKELELLSTSTESNIPEFQKNLAILKQKEQERLSTFTENSIPVKEIRRQILQAENRLHEYRNQIHSSTAAREIRRQITEAENRLRNHQLHIQKINDSAFRIAQLEREKAIIEENYRKYATSMEQTRIDQALEEEKISNIRLVQAPTLSKEPIRPNTGLIMFMGLFFAAFGAVGLAFFSEYMDNSLQRPEQIEEILHLPVLVSIPKMEK